MLNWKQYKIQLMRRLGSFAKLSPETMKGYQTLAKANEGGALDAKTRELISLACAVTTRCDECRRRHGVFCPRS